MQVVFATVVAIYGYEKLEGRGGCILSSFAPCQAHPSLLSIKLLVKCLNRGNDITRRGSLVVIIWHTFLSSLRCPTIGLASRQRSVNLNTPRSSSLSIY